MSTSFLASPGPGQDRDLSPSHGWAQSNKALRVLPAVALARSSGGPEVSCGMQPVCLCTQRGQDCCRLAHGFCFAAAGHHSLPEALGSLLCAECRTDDHKSRESWPLRLGLLQAPLYPVQVPRHHSAHLPVPSSLSLRARQVCLQCHPKVFQGTQAWPPEWPRVGLGPCWPCCRAAYLWPCCPRNLPQSPQANRALKRSKA